MLIAHADASLHDDLLSVGTAIFRLSDRGQYQFVESRFRCFNRDELNRDYCSNRAEYRACISAARQALDYENKTLLLYTDNQGVANKINSRGRFDGDGYYHHALFSFLERFDHYRVKWIRRENNTVAHQQAQHGANIQQHLREKNVEA